MRTETSGARTGFPGTLVLSALLSFAAAQAANGQVDLAQAVFECAQISLDRARLACFDAIGSADRAPPPATVESAAEPQPTPASQGDLARVSIEAEAEPGAMGAVIVTNVRTDSLGRRSFVLQDGRILDQISVRKFDYPEEPFAATLEPGSLGSIFLQATSRRQSVRVRVRD